MPALRRNRSENLEVMAQPRVPEKVPKKNPAGDQPGSKASRWNEPLGGFVLGVVFVDDLAALWPLVEIDLDEADGFGL